MEQGGWGDLWVGSHFRNQLIRVAASLRDGFAEWGEGSAPDGYCSRRVLEVGVVADASTSMGAGLAADMVTSARGSTC